jgi:hypothetical protein
MACKWSGCSHYGFHSIFPTMPHHQLQLCHQTILTLCALWSKDSSS